VPSKQNDQTNLSAPEVHFVAQGAQILQTLPFIAVWSADVARWVRCGLSVSGPLADSASLSGPCSFPHHRMGCADFSLPVLGERFTMSPTKNSCPFGKADQAERLSESLVAGHLFVRRCPCNMLEYLMNMAANAVLKCKAAASHEAGSSCIGALGPNRPRLKRLLVRYPQDLAVETTHQSIRPR
jgi:hypothetical protein